MVLNTQETLFSVLEAAELLRFGFFLFILYTQKTEPNSTLCERGAARSAASGIFIRAAARDPRLGGNLQSSAESSVT